jgi:hypothetical protein
MSGITAAITIDDAPWASRPQVMRPRQTATTTAKQTDRRVRRLVLAAIAAAVLAACAVWTQAGAVGRTGSGPLAVPGAGPAQVIAAHAWVVQPGDTLWSIAHDLQPIGDVRNLVDELSAEVGGRPLQVGQRILIP